jgi:hypothetical protein
LLINVEPRTHQKQIRAQTPRAEESTTPAMNVHDFG